MFEFVSQQTIEIEQLLPPQLAVSCPDTVLRGQVTTCTARAVPASAGLSVTQWTFSGTADLNAGPAGSSTFTFKPQSSGSVTVRATVGGANLAATTTVTALTDSMIAADPNDPPATPTNPRLVCTPSVQRGANVTCVVEGATVAGWSFSDGALIAISHTSTSAVWAGTAVVEGTVTAHISVNGAAQTLNKFFAVTSRQWSWGPAQWSHDRDAGQACFSDRPVVNIRITWGWNRIKGTCHGGRLSPDPTINRGLWYVTTVSFRMDTESRINPGLTAGAPAFLLPNGPQADKCRLALGLAPSDPVVVNFYTYNTDCEGYSLTAFFDGILNHEGFGSGTNNGHEAQAWIAAAKPENNLYQLVEGLVEATEAATRDNAVNLWDIVRQRITDASAPHVLVRNNWCGSVWMWNGQTNKYEFVPIVGDSNQCL
jgi:hypothetical protein